MGAAFNLSNYLVQGHGQILNLSQQFPLPVMEQDGRRMYMGQDYEIMVETLASGDLNDTIRTISGFEKDQLTVLQTQQADADRYDFVWTTTGEGGERLGRAVILDDGNYHYCMTVLRDAEESIVVWQDVFSSFNLV